jgi:hypothetical protein
VHILGVTQRPVEAPSSPFGGARNPDSVPIPLLQTVSRRGVPGNRTAPVRYPCIGPDTSEVFTRGLVFSETHLTCSGGPARAALPVKRSKPNQATAAPRTIATAGKGMKGSTAPTMSNPVEPLITLSTSVTNPFFAARAASRVLGC